MTLFTIALSRSQESEWHFHLVIPTPLTMTFSPRHCDRQGSNLSRHCDPPKQSLGALGIASGGGKIKIIDL
uniref:hypothetical protein n=1 Tax=Okeania sp. SIO2F4 TaxID=2607790 RepID=UPI002600CF20|nr:hypothetical protein [Okeania sp. SIO2F4]